MMRVNDKGKEERTALVAWFRGALMMVRLAYSPCLYQTMWFLTRPVVIVTVILALFITQAFAGRPGEVLVCQLDCVKTLFGGAVALAGAVLLGPLFFILAPARMRYATRLYFIAVVISVLGSVVAIQVYEPQDFLSLIFTVFNFSGISSIILVSGIFLFVSLYRVEFLKRCDSVFECVKNEEFIQEEPLQRLLPPELRGQIKEIQVEDKYLRVFTEKGEHVIRKSLSEAINGIQDKNGLKIHRSRWVRFDQLEDIFHENGNPRVLLRSGKWIPASRGVVDQINVALNKKNKADLT